jgi:hypothetical protein
MIAPILLFLAQGASEIKALDSQWMSGLHEVDGGSWAIEAGETVSLMDSQGRETQTIKIPERSAFLGFNGRNEPLFGPSHYPSVHAGEKADRVPSVRPNIWNLMFERGTYLEYSPGAVRVQTGDDGTYISGLRWRDPVCVGRDEKALYVLRTDHDRTRLDRFALGGQKAGAKRSLNVHTRNGQPLRALVGWSMSIAPLDKHYLITFCEPGPFTAAERGAAPRAISGKPNDIDPHDEALCVIDTRTGIATLLFRLSHFLKGPGDDDNRLPPIHEGPSIGPGEERRRDLAVLPGTDTFVARWGPNLFFCRIGKNAIPGRGTSADRL